MDLLTAGLWCGDKIAQVLAHHWVEAFLERHGFTKEGQGGGTTINNYNVQIVVNAPPATPPPVAPSVTPELPAPAKIELRLNPSPYRTVKCGSCSNYVVTLGSSEYCSDCRAGTPKAERWKPEPFTTEQEYTAKILRHGITFAKP